MRGSGRHAPSLLTTDVLLCTYSGERLNIRGEIKVDAQFRDKQTSLNLLVVVGNGPSLMGRDWISALQPNLSVLRPSILTTASNHYWANIQSCSRRSWVR